MKSGAHIVVGMSGGVDSSVAALRLVRAGYRVTGAFMKNWSEEKSGAGECSWREERRDAERVAAKLDIPLVTFDFEEAYRREVLANMDAEYRGGRTPNPDVICNEKIKFDAFYHAAMAYGAEGIATGHYAQLRDGHLYSARDVSKDQVYFLYRAPKEALQKTLFPVGDLLKSEVRTLAEEAGLPTAKKKDSQGLCFVGNINMHEFLSRRLAPTPGEVRLKDGTVIGHHDGAAYYTIGQRHGLALGREHAVYVIERDTERNVVTVTEDRNDPALLRTVVRLENERWLEPTTDGMSVEAQVRYRAPHAPATVRKLENGTTEIVFSTAQWAPAPGQSCVVYRGELVIGGGIISSTN